MFGLAVIKKDMWKKTATEIIKVDLFGCFVQKQTFCWPLYSSSHVCCQKDALSLSLSSSATYRRKINEDNVQEISHRACLGVVAGEFSLNHVVWTACCIQGKFRASLVLFHCIALRNVWSQIQYRLFIEFVPLAFLILISFRQCFRPRDSAWCSQSLEYHP